MSNQFSHVEDTFRPDTLIASTLNANSINAVNLSAVNNAFLGNTVTAYLPSSYYKSPFPFGQTIQLVDNNSNLIALPFGSNLWLTQTYGYIKNFGPDLTKGGTWAQGVAGIRFGVNYINGGGQTQEFGNYALPWNYNELILSTANGFSIGNGNYTGAFQTGHVHTGIAYAPVTNLITPVGNTGRNYLCMTLIGAGTPGTGFGVGILKFYVYYIQI